MKKLALFTRIGLLILMVVFVACSKDETQGGLSLKFQASKSNLKSSLANNIVIESFVINIGEIELEFDENDPMFASDSIATDIELKGPFEVDLMKGGNPLATLIAQNVKLPQAAYDEIEFKFRESKNPVSELNGKSILIKGTVNGTPFIFWTDEEIEVEIEFESYVFLEEAQRAYITVTFDIISLFNPALGGVDISGAIDGNDNGIIEISKADVDGNELIAKSIWERIEFIIDAFED